MKASPTLGAIAPALAKAQAELRPAVFDSVNPAFKSKYASVTAVIDAARGALAKQQIALVQCATAAGPVVSVETVLLHASGEWISETLSIQARDASAQAVGSALTYARRYSLSALVCIAADEDDDGTLAQPHGGHVNTRTGEIHEPPKAAPAPAPKAEAAPAKPSEAPPARGKKDTISEAQQKRLFAVAKGAGWETADIKAVLKGRGFEHTSEIPWRQYDDIIAFFERGPHDELPEPDEAPEADDDAPF